MSNLATSIQQKQADIKSVNPFYGNGSLLSLSHQLAKGMASKSMFHSTLSKAWASCKTKEEKELFFVLLFNAGDIDRQHNIFKQAGYKKVDKGGNAQRNTFIWALQWIYNTIPDQYFAFLPLIPEYTNWENIMYYQLRTDRKKGTIISDENYGPTAGKTESKFIDRVTEHLANVIQNPATTAAEHTLIAKFLRKPRFSTRKRNPQSKKKGRRKLQSATIQKELFEFKLIEALSSKLGWEIAKYPSNTRFVGFEKYKAKYNRTSEAYLFSSKEILNYDEEKFSKWLDTLPAGARYNVQRRLLDAKRISKGKWVGKYGDLAQFFKNWEDRKTVASEKARVLEAKENLTEEEAHELKILKKQAAVNTGALNFMDVFKSFLLDSNPTSANLVADNLMRNIKLDVPMLVVVDNSGSMNHRAMNNATSRIKVASLAATIALLKNPSAEGKDILVKFNSTCTIMVQGEEIEFQAPRKNRFLDSVATKVSSIVDKSKSFYDNYMNVLGLLKTDGSTNLESFAAKVKEWVNEVPGQEDMRKEMINKFSVILVISDGDLNSRGSAMPSLQAAKQGLMQATGWDGIFVLWDVKDKAEGHKFEFVDNILHIPYVNAQTINQVFNNLSDIDIVDSYASLKALYESNRYELVKAKVI